MDEDRDGDSRLRRWLASLDFRRASGWMGDTARFAWALVALNLRKTVFRLRRGRGRCPCQDPSDSGRAYETGCDAVTHWHSPARFRRVCPLLRQGSDGAWRCSVDTAGVRPFWGRAAGYGAGAAVAAYLAATLAIFGFLRVVGYPVRYESVAWPRAWHEIREARGRYFFTKAEAALRGNRPGPALMWLAQSYELDPANYSAGRILAQIWEAGGPEYSNRLYRRLMHDHPEERSATAQAWFAALLAHGDFAAIESLSGEQLGVDPAHATAWLNAFLFANRRTGHLAILEETAANALLPLSFRQICGWEIALRAGGREEARQLLAQPLPNAEATPYLVYYRTERLLDAGFPGEALSELNRYRDRMTARDQTSLALDIYQALGWQAFLCDQVDRLLADSPGAPLVELLSAHLIRHPDRVLLAKVCVAVDRRPLPADGQENAAYLSLFCAAGAAGDWGQMDRIAARLQPTAGPRYPALSGMEMYFRTYYRSNPLEQYLAILPALPIEVDYALFDFSARRRIAPKPARIAAAPATTAP